MLYLCAAQSFPTPMEEPKKVLRAQYLGSMQVNQATGMEVLNEAIEHIVTNTPINQWRNVNVAVAPSMISILTPNVSKETSTSTKLIKMQSTIHNIVIFSGRQAHHRMSSTLPVIPRYRPQRKAMCFHYAYRTGLVHRTRLQL